MLSEFGLSIVTSKASELDSLALARLAPQF